MGWKATKTISREKAIDLIVERVLTATNEDLGSALERLGFGDNTSLPHYGYNFVVVSEGHPDLQEENENDEDDDEEDDDLLDFSGLGISDNQEE